MATPLEEASITTAPPAVVATAIATAPAPTDPHPPANAPDSLINHADAIDYWQGIDADVNGMLGGFPYISRVDLQGSRNFLTKCGLVLRKGASRSGLRSAEEAVESPRVERVVDCGAG